MRALYLISTFALVLLVSIFGLRNRRFVRPPMDVFPEWAFPGMKYQPKLAQQSPSAFFSDGRLDRAAPPNTVPASFLLPFTVVPYRFPFASSTKGDCG